MTPDLDRVDPVLFVAKGRAAGGAGASSALAGRVIGASRFVDPSSGQPVDGTIGDGSFTVTGFGVAGGVLEVAGTLAGTCTGEELTGPAFTLEFAAPADIGITRAPGGCRTLRVRIDPVDVDGPRFALHTAEVVVSLTAPTGPGHLPGNLLVAIGNGLSSGAPAGHVADLLNHVVTLSG